MNDNPIKKAFDTFDLLTKCDVDEETAFESFQKTFNESTQDAQLAWKKNALLKAAKTEITNSMLHPGKSEIALESIPLADPIYGGCTIADLPSAVAAAIAQPYGTLGLGDCPLYGATESPWYIFQHTAVNFMRGKISRATMRKLRQTAERLELAIGCIQWAGTVGVHDIPQFQDAFTSALILDRDATAELNGEVIDVKPDETKMPLEKSVLMLILNRVNSLVAGQEEIKDEIRNAKPKTNRRREVSIENACEILERLNCPKCGKTIQRWLRGQHTPEGFTPEKMQSVEAFTAWATIYAHREQSKINTDNALRIDNPKNRKLQKFR